MNQNNFELSVSVLEKPPMLYHGSPHKDIEVFEPRPTTFNHTQKGEYVLGTPDFVNALPYLFSGFINGVGNEPKIVGAAFNKSVQGKASGLIAGNSGVFAVKGESVAAKASDALPETVKQSLIQNRKMAIYRSVEALRKAATVKDYRFSFY